MARNLRWIRQERRERRTARSARRTRVAARIQPERARYNAARDRRQLVRNRWRTAIRRVVYRRPSSRFWRWRQSAPAA